jgi:hypothetical protein
MLIMSKSPFLFNNLVCLNLIYFSDQAAICIRSVIRRLQRRNRICKYHAQELRIVKGKQLGYRYVSVLDVTTCVLFRNSRRADV